MRNASAATAHGGGLQLARGCPSLRLLWLGGVVGRKMVMLLKLVVRAADDVVVEIVIG